MGARSARSGKEQLERGTNRASHSVIMPPSRWATCEAETSQNNQRVEGQRLSEGKLAMCGMGRHLCGVRAVAGGDAAAILAEA